MLLDVAVTGTTSIDRWGIDTLKRYPGHVPPRKGNKQSDFVLTILQGTSESI